MNGWVDDSETDEVEGAVVATTAKAVLLDIEGSEHWIPRSVIVDPTQFRQGDYLTVTVQTWFLKKEGIA